MRPALPAQAVDSIHHAQRTVAAWQSGMEGSSGGQVGGILVKEMHEEEGEPDVVRLGVGGLVAEVVLEGVARTVC